MSDGGAVSSDGRVRSTSSNAHYADIVEPAAALSALERELDKLVADFSESGAPPDAQAICDAICTLIKEECNAEVRGVAAVPCAGMPLHVTTPDAAQPGGPCVERGVVS